MYESPVKIIEGEFETKVENEIFKAIKQFNVDVDREELIKALKYDRDQYAKGYKDGVKEFAENVRQTLIDKGFYPAIVKSVLEATEKEMVEPSDNHFPDVKKMVKAIALIEDFIEEPNSIASDWLEAMKLCLRLLREKVDG